MASKSKSIQTRTGVDNLRLEVVDSRKELTEVKGELQKSNNKITAIQAEITKALQMLAENKPIEARKILLGLIVG